jgi:hypothetical protein
MEKQSYVMFTPMALFIAITYEKRPLYLALLAGWDCSIYSAYDLAIERH